MNRYLTNEKIGNLLTLLASRCEPLYLTKALKLLYLIDEKAFQEGGQPITWLTYKVWKMGPVPDEIYLELKHQQEPEKIFGKTLDLGPYVGIEKASYRDHDNTARLVPGAPFDDQEFSDFEIDIIESIISEFGKKPAQELVEWVHRPEGLWARVVRAHALDSKYFDKGVNTSDYFIDFTELIQTDKDKLQQFVNAKLSNERHLELIQQAFEYGRDDK